MTGERDLPIVVAEPARCEGLRCADWRVVTGQPYTHRGARSNLARQIDISMMGFDNVFGDGQGFKARLAWYLDVTES